MARCRSRRGAAAGCVLGLLLAVSAQAEPGVTPERVVLGQPAAFSGPAAELGVEMWRGAMAAFAEANAKGGVHGRRVELRVADDGYDPERAAPAVLRLLQGQGVFALFGGVGTPTMVKALPVVLRAHREAGLFYFANFTGAQPQRQRPYSDAVLNVRASYREETQAMVDAFVRSGRRRIGVFIQADAYGASGKDGVRQALARHNLKLAAETTYPRGQRLEVSAALPVRLLREAGVDAVVAVGTSQACAAFVRDARVAGWQVPIHNVSFVGADALLDLLVREGKRLNQDLTRNLVNTQVVPFYGDVRLPAVREYRAAMDRFPARFPPGLEAPATLSSPRYSFGTLEGYLSARAFLAVLQRTGPELTRARFLATAEAMSTFDLGLGEPASFGPDDHQALGRVWFTYATPDGWQPVDDPVTVLR